MKVHRGITSLALLPAACSMNPPLRMPPAPIPARYAGQDVGPVGIGPHSWRHSETDPRLARLVELALANNRDLALAVLETAAARTAAGIADAEGRPAIDLHADYRRSSADAGFATSGLARRLLQGRAPGRLDVEQYQLGARLTAFELDLFGRLRSQSQAAFARYIATREGHASAEIVVSAAVAEAYLSQRRLVEQLALARLIAADWGSSAALVRQRFHAGFGDATQVADAELGLEDAGAQVARLEREVIRAHNTIVLIVGLEELPADLPPPQPIASIPITSAVPPGLPSDLLKNRPDIRAAEQELIAANADVGAARAAFFPRLSLTAALGLATLNLSNLFEGSSRAWSYSPSVAMPVFAGGRLKGELRLAEIRKSQAILRYERTIQAAFREVMDELGTRSSLLKEIDARQSASGAATRRFLRSEERYRSGWSDRLELLDARRRRNAENMALVGARASACINAARLLAVLGMSRRAWDESGVTGLDAVRSIRIRKGGSQADHSADPDTGKEIQ